MLRIMASNANHQQDSDSLLINRCKPVTALAVSFLVALLTMTAQQTFIGSFWQTNDDVGQMLIASGTAIAEKDAHLLTPLIFFGWLATALYELFPDSPCYFALIEFFLLLASTGINYALLRSHPLRIALLLLLAITLTINSYILVALQFTSVAFYLGSAGALLTLYGFHSQNLETKERNLVAISSLCLFFLATILRASCGFLTEFLTLAGLFIQIISKKNFAPRFYLIMPLLALLISGGLSLLSRTIVNTEGDWKAFESSRAALVRIIDFGGFSDDSKKLILEKAQWSENDLLAIQSFIYADEHTFSHRKIIEAAEHIPTARENLSVNVLLNQFSVVFSDKLLLPPVLISFFLALFLCNRSGKIQYFVMAASIGCCLAYLICCLKIPARVYYPLISFQLLYTSLLIENRLVISLPLWHRNWWRRLCTISLLCFVVVSTCYVQYRWLWRIARQQKVKTANLELALKRIPQEKKYVVLCWAFPYELVSPQANLKHVFGKLQFLALGAQNNSPVFKRHQARMGIENVFLGCIDNPSVLIIGNDWLNSIFIRYINEHFGIECSAIPTTYFEGNSFQVYKIKRGNEFK